ncbi:MAG: arginine--tRNA ligase [bacterium]
MKDNLKSTKKNAQDHRKTILSVVAESIQLAYERAGYGVISLSEARATVTFCDIGFGDFASNIGLQKAASQQLPPREIAEKVIAELNQQEAIASCELAGPGFINVRLHDEIWNEYIASLDDRYFESQLGHNKSINIEFISANPTGPLVLVNAWGGFYGDILARLYASQGYTVTREYYLNNGGNQIAQLGRAIQQVAGKQFTEEESAELYRGEYIDKLESALTSRHGNSEALINLDPAILGDEAQKIIFSDLIKPTLLRLEIEHDVVYPETDLDNQLTLERLDAVGAIKRYDDAIWLDGDKAGLEKDEVLVRSTDGQDTYFLKDISYQYNKLKDRSFDQAITIVGPDHHGQEQRLIAALKLLGVDGFIPLWTQAVRLIRDGEEFKMSKRRGNYIVLDEFLDIVPSQTARFFYGMRDPNTHFDLDLDIVSSQNKHNPMYYVMYAFVRMNSILAKAQIEHVAAPLNDSYSQSDRAMLRQLIVIQEKIHLAITNQQVHPVLFSMIEFAALFHDWYERNPILSAEPNERARLLWRVTQYQKALRGLLELIGITPLERME